MPFAVPPSASRAAFLVLSAALLISASFHFGRSQAHIPSIPFSFIRFSSFKSGGCFFFLAHLRVAAGCGLSGDEVKIFY
jgi:hypothetical protein